MRTRPVPPEGMLTIKARIGAIKNRFRGPEAQFASALVAAESAPPDPSASFVASRVKQAIAAAAQRNGLDPDLLLAVAQVESGLRPDAVSPKGALGIMQLMPSTAASLGVQDGFDIEANVEGGARYLRQLLDRFGGDISLALAAYNAGPGAVGRYGGIPAFDETQRFVSNVLSRLSASD